MRVLDVATIGLLLTVVLSGCGREDDRAARLGVERDRATAATGSDAAPAVVPAAPGLVFSRGLVTVIDRDTTTEGQKVCLGPVRESAPPQCDGPSIEGWSWTDRPGFEHRAGIRWGLYTVSGRWDGTVLTVRSAVQAALYDAPAPTPSSTPSPATSYSPAELERIEVEVLALPGVLDHAVEGDHVELTVTYDDGTLASYLDRRHGVDVVQVSSALVDAERATAGRPAPGSG